MTIENNKFRVKYYLALSTNNHFFYEVLRTDKCYNLAFQTVNLLLFNHICQFWPLWLMENQNWPKCSENAPIFTIEKSKLPFNIFIN